MYGTSDQEGSTGLFMQIMTDKFGSKIDEANDTDPVPDQVKNASIISNTSEPLKTHLQLNFGKLGNFNALRVATEDYLRSRRIFKTTSAGNTRDVVDAVSRKEKGNKGHGKTTTENSRFDGECRKGTGKSKSKVTEISESDNSKQVDDWNPSSNTSTQQPN